MTLLVRSGQPRDDDIDALRSRAAELDAILGERAAEITRAQSDLAAFGIRYRQDVGLLHEELDELERAIAEAELGELSKLVESESGAGGQTSPPAGPRPTRRPDSRPTRFAACFAKSRRPSIPTSARDDLARDQRHTLMVEANRAYALGDEERLRWILGAWERSPEAVQGDDPEATRLRLVRRIAQIEEQLTACASDLAAMQDSPLWKLKAMVDDASARGKDLVADMVRRLKRDIMAARNRLDAMQWNP